MSMLLNAWMHGLPWCSDNFDMAPRDPETGQLIEEEWKPGRCCEKQGIANMDHIDSDGRMIVNRVCLNCFHHWYGRNGNIDEYSKKEWDAWLADAFI